MSLGSHALGTVALGFVEPPTPVGITLVIQNTSQTESLDNITLTTQSTLNIADTNQTELLDNVELALSSVLDVNNTHQTESLDNVALILASTLSINDINQAQSLDNIDLTQSSVLVIHDSASTETLDSIVLSLQTQLSIDDLQQIETLDNIDLSLSSVLDIQDTQQSELLDGDLALIYIPSGGGSCPTVEQIAQAVWSEARAVSLITDVELIRSIEEGAWVITGNQMIFYKPDNTTELMRFDLKDKAGNATEANAFERVRV